MKKTSKQIIKYFKISLLIFYSICNGNLLFSQKVAVIGLDHSSGTASNGSYAYTVFDGFSFVATQDINQNEIIYFTNAYYDNTVTRFRRSINPADDPNKWCVKYTVPVGGIAKGKVVRFQETGTSTNILNITCSSGACGSAVLLSGGSAGFSGNFSVAGGQGLLLYAFEKTNGSGNGNDDPYSGTVTAVHSLLYDGLSENFVPIYGGNVPAGMNPVTNFSTAIVVDGFPTALPNTPGSGIAYFTTVDFKVALRSGAVSKITLEDPASYNYNPAEIPETVLSETSFTNLNLVASNPTVSVAVSPSSVVEDGATNLTYTFTVSSTSVSARTINFSVGGTAQFSSDYAVTGSSAFTINNGSVVIPANSNSASVIINPVNETTLEADETVTLTVLGGVGYDAGSPSSATGTITNDDADLSQPKIALVGINHGSTGTDIESFSFVALEDIPQNTLFYFTHNGYDKLSLKFINAGFEVIKWTAPSGVNRGDVYVITEDAAGTSFTVTCSAGESSCGTAILQTGGALSFALAGTTLSAYSDNDTDPFTTGVGQIHSVLHTGAGSPGGVMSAAINPSSIYPNAVIIENFPAASPLRTEYKFAAGERAISINRSLFTDTANWVHAGSLQTVSNIRFANITITNGVTLPQVIVNAAPSTVNENGGTSIIFTFTASQNATSDITLNFNIGGLATLTADYTVSSSPASGFTFGGSGGVGTIKILTGTNTATISVSQVADAMLEPNETIVITTIGGAGYDVGSPSEATGTIVNDDVLNAGPLVAIIGVNAGTTINQNPDGFSFVAGEDIPANTDIYFTTNPFNNTTLAFTPNFYVVKYTSGAIAKGQVVYVVETGPSTNAFTVTCSSGSNCGTVSLIAGDFSFSSGGVRFFAYSDADDNPANSIKAVHSMFYTYIGAVPTNENPNTVYPNAIVIEGFSTAVPDRTEHKFAAGERSNPVSISSIKNISNYLIGQSTQNLSIIPFTTLSLCPANINTQASNADVAVNGNTQFSIVASGTNLTYQWQVNTGSGFVNILNGGVYTGTTSATLLLTSVPCTFVNYSYRCLVNDCAISESKSLTLNIPAIPNTTNNGLKFDGVNDFVVANYCTAQPIITGGSAITVEYWFKGSNIQSAVRTQDSDNDYMVAGWSFPAVHILSNDQGTSGGLSVGAAATDGQWHHVAFTWQQNTTNGFKSYLDGELVQQRNSSNNPLPNINNPLYLGAFQGNSEFMNGTLDNVRIWNVARNQTQIRAGMCNLALPQTGLMVFYSFDHGTINSNNTANLLENKASLTNYTGVLNNFSLTGSNSNWVQGVIPNTLAAGPVTVIQNVTTNPIFTDINCNALGKVEPAGISAVAGNVTFKSFLEPPSALIYLSRHYEINPLNAPTVSTANVTLYFTQADFDNYNILSTIKLPANPTDPNIANIALFKFSGTSAPNNDGLPSSYGIQPTNISSNIISKTWNGQFWEIKFSTTGFSGFFIGSTNSNPLPVNLISFSGKATEKGNELTWKTSNEKDFSHFEIERSIDAKKFEKIGEVKGNNIENYTFLDNSININPNYYHLKLVDLNGNHQYSKIIFLISEVASIIIYPNPATNILYLENFEGNEVEIINQIGQLIYYKCQKIDKNKSKIEISQLPKGLYYIKTKENKYLKFLKD